MTPEQCRAARGWLAMTSGNLAEAAGVPVTAVAVFEAGQPPFDSATIAAIRDAFEAAGIGFTFILDGEGSKPCGITFTPAHAAS